MTATLPDEFYVPERALAIAAHADDLEFGVAGTVARWTDAGAKVSYCIVTNNSSGSNDPDADITALVETRRREQIAAAAVLGVHDVRFLNYSDGVLQPTLELRRDLTRLIRELRPQAVIITDPTTVIVEESNYINHPDHRAAGEAALYAVFPSSETRPIFPELLEEGLEPHKVDRLYLVLTPRPNLVVDITPTIERKLRALGCHASQLGEEVVEMVRGWNAEAGKEHGIGYAEVFKVMILNGATETPPDQSEE
jgi:LmbE family N-acetylglucosaminyl deacetylase